MVVQHLPRVVRTLVDPQSRRMQEADFSEINALELPDENKAIILTHVLVRYDGERSVTTALSSLVPFPGGGGAAGAGAAAAAAGGVGRPACGM